MKKAIAFFLVVVGSLNATGQNSYGKHMYPHPRTECSSGALGITNPGFLIAGYRAATPPSGPNFFIDRTDMGGVFTGSPYEFQYEYYTYAPLTCTNYSSYHVNDCYGVSVIEDPASNSYLAVGANTIGAFMTNIAANGVPNSAVGYPFIYPAQGTKPIIARSVVHPNEYYVCGGYDNILYAMRIDASGNIMASLAISINTLTVLPKAMVESPFGNNDLTIVGAYDNGNNLDAMFIQIDNNLTAPVLLTSSEINGNWSGNTCYLSITASDPGNVTNPGFLIGGNSDYAWVNGGQSLMLKVDKGGIPSWCKIINGTWATVNYSVTGVAERYSAANNKFEAYGAAHSTVGIVVFKLDDNGGVPMSQVNGNVDEFIYNDGSNTVARPVGMSFYNNGVPFDEGLHIYGNSESTPASHYLVQSYFSGEGGCNNPIIKILAAVHHTLWTYSPSYTYTTPPSPCLFTVTALQSPTYVAACSPKSSLPPPASNSRVMALSETAAANGLNVFPNPSGDNFILDAATFSEAEIKITDVMGRNCAFEMQSQTAGSKVVIKPVNWKPGVYFLSVDKGGTKATTKLLYGNP